MRWRLGERLDRCSPDRITLLLSDQLDEKATRQLARHLDRCETCQQNLTERSGDAKWWLDASRWLELLGADEPDATAPDIEEQAGQFEDAYYGPTPAQTLIDCGVLEPSDEPDCIGRLGRYLVNQVIGSGGTGIVVRASDTELNRIVAIKFLSPALAISGPARQRFAREGKAAAAVGHENVVAIFHVEAQGPVPYLVMQYIDGQSLQDCIASTGPLDDTSALRLTSQIASALSAAHAQGLVHRDVKPANILIGSGGQRAWISDFGLARAVDDASLTRTGFIAGTPHYMSPEQARGEAVSSASDLFGLGSVLYFMLTGRPPFRAERTLAILSRICDQPHRPVREVIAQVSEPVAQLVDCLLEKEASARFSSATAVRERCEQLLADGAASKPRTRPLATQKTFWSRPSRSGLIVSGLLLVIACASMYRLRANHLQSRVQRQTHRQAILPAFTGRPMNRANAGSSAPAGSRNHGYSPALLGQAPQVNGDSWSTSRQQFSLPAIPQTLPSIPAKSSRSSTTSQRQTVAQNVDYSQPQPSNSTRLPTFLDPGEATTWLATFTRLSAQVQQLESARITRLPSSQTTTVHDDSFDRSLLSLEYDLRSLAGEQPARANHITY